MENVEVDFAVVGAGFAGLTAAWRLTNVDSPPRMIVLEARPDRVGGRVWTDTLDDGTWLDKGGTWFGPGQEYSYKLAEEMGACTYPTYTDGDSILVLEDGTIVRYAEDFPLDHLFPALGGLAVMEEFAAMAKKLPLDAPWEGTHAAEWDKQTFAAWVDSQLDDSSFALARMALKTIMMGVFCIDTAELSLLDALYLIRSHHGFTRLMSVKGGDQQDRIIGGAQSIANTIASKLGDRIRLGTPVRTIKHDDDSVTVIADNLTVRAKRVIVAIPPTLAGHIQYEPLLPAGRVQLLQRTPVGSVLKVVTVYDEAWWRDDDLTGQSFALADPVGATFDGCTDTGTPGVLISFVFGPNARAFGRLTKEERQQRIVDSLVKRFGSDAADVRLYEEVEWADQQWTQGGMFAHFPTGVLTNYGSLIQEPVGRIHWAGTETSSAFHGSINGAIESGERAAKEVVDAES